MCCCCSLCCSRRCTISSHSRSMAINRRSIVSMFSARRARSSAASACRFQCSVCPLSDLAVVSDVSARCSACSARRNAFARSCMCESPLPSSLMLDMRAARLLLPRLLLHPWKEAGTWASLLATRTSGDSASPLAPSASAHWRRGGTADPPCDRPFMILRASSVEDDIGASSATQARASRWRGPGEWTLLGPSLRRFLLLTQSLLSHTVTQDDLT